MWVGLRETFIADEGNQESYEVFVQWKAGDRHQHVGSVDACCGCEAKAKCKEQFVGDKSFYTIWTAPISRLTKIDGDKDMIWRETTDQGYRLPRGYSRVVRQKWDALRAEQAVDTYQEEDLKETF